MTKKYLSLLPILLGCIVACNSNTNEEEPIDSTSNNITMGVASDLHYYDSDLGIEGEAFEAYIANDRKLIAESEALMEAFTQAAINSGWDYLLVPGDLTKDGEYDSHNELTTYFERIEAAGTQVYVVPGNHDINNGESNSYSGSTTTRVDNVSPAEFKSLFDNYGYNQALATDENSLSYVARLSDNLILIAMDSCKYDANEDDKAPETSGAFKTETYAWILEQIDTYVASGNTVIGMMHHGIVEHHPNQKEYFTEYLVDDYESVSEAFTEHGMHVVLTGHYHAQDIAMHHSNSGDIYDVMTGSLVTYPTPYRSIEWRDNSFNITSTNIEDINYAYTGDSFQKYAYDYLIKGLSGQVPYYAAAAMDTDGNLTADELIAAKGILSTKINSLLSTTPASDNDLTISDLLVDSFAVFYQGKDKDLLSGAATSSIDNTYAIITDLADPSKYNLAYTPYSSVYIMTAGFANMLWAESYSPLDEKYSFMLADDNTYTIDLN